MVGLGQKLRGSDDMPETSIFFARVVYTAQIGLMRRGYEEDIRVALTPNGPVTRYSRNWRLSQPALLEDKVLADRFLVGKFGFESSGQERRSYWDNEKKDFIESPSNVKQSYYSQWALDMTEHVIAFESNPPLIYYHSFFGAFKDLLNLHPEVGLTIENILESSEFFQWVGTVERLTKFTAKLRAPNPDYAGRTETILKILRDTNADHAKVEVSKDKDSQESLDTDKTIRDLVEYGKDGYSEVVARGLTRQGQPRMFDSKQRMPIHRAELPTAATVPTIWQSLIDALKRFKNEKH